MGQVLISKFKVKIWILDVAYIPLPHSKRELSGIYPFNAGI